MPRQDQHAQFKNSLLVASPVLVGGIFERAVIYIADSNDENGTLGFILNKETGKTLGDPSLPGNLKLMPVNVGGPVNPDQLTFAAFSLRNGKIKAETFIEMNSADKLGRQPGTSVFAFTGFAGWEPGQLTDELNTFSWFHLPLSGVILQGNRNEEMWKNALSAFSPYHAIMAQASKKPYLN